MARKPRIHVPGGVYHVMLRGNGGQAIFFCNEDRYRLYLLVQEGVIRFGYRVHGFCWMTNHLHMAVQVGDIPLSRCIQNLPFRYTRWINRRQKRVGHLFQGRYQAVLIDRDSYLLELVRYIHLNPVRAGMVDGPRDYPWSGHKAYLGEEAIPWLTTEWVLGQFGRRLGEARQRYGAFVREGIREGYREELHRGSKDPRVVGDEDFVEEVLSELDQWVGAVPTVDRIVRSVCAAYGLEEDELKASRQGRIASEARAIVGWLAMEFGCASLTEVGRRFDRDVGTMSSAVRRLIDRARDFEALREQMERLKSSIG